LVEIMKDRLANFFNPSFRMNHFYRKNLTLPENLKLFDSAAVLIEEFKLPENTDEIHSVILGLNSFLGHKRMRIRKMKAIEIFQWLLKSVIVPIVVTIITTWIIMKYFPNG
jgi:hypothetical protein